MSVTGRIIKRWMARNVWMKSLKVLLLIQLDKVLGVLDLSEWNVSCAIEWVYSKRCLIKNWYLSSGLCERSLQTDGAVLLSFNSYSLLNNHYVVDTSIVTYMYVTFLALFISCMINVSELWLYELLIKVYLYYTVLVKHFKDYIDINIFEFSVHSNF